MNVVSAAIKEIEMKYLMMLFLLISMIYDIKEQKIPAVWLGGNLFIGVIYRVFFWKEGNGMDILYAILPGMFLFILAKITHQVGVGDGYLIMGTGCFFTISNHMKMLFLAFLMAAGFAVGTVLVKRNRENRKIPFAPFVFAASIITQW